MINCMKGSIGSVERVAKVLCETFNGVGSSMVLYDGLYEIPYGKIHNNYVDGKTYYFDNVILVDGNQQFQFYGFRSWCYRVNDLVDALKNEGVCLKEIEKEPEINEIRNND